MLRMIKGTDTGWGIRTRAGHKPCARGILLLVVSLTLRVVEMLALLAIGLVLLVFAGSGFYIIPVEEMELGKPPRQQRSGRPATRSKYRSSGRAQSGNCACAATEATRPKPFTLGRVHNPPNAVYAPWPDIPTLNPRPCAGVARDLGRVLISGAAPRPGRAAQAARPAPPWRRRAADRLRAECGVPVFPGKALKSNANRHPSLSARKRGGWQPPPGLRLALMPLGLRFVGVRLGF